MNIGDDNRLKSMFQMGTIVGVHRRSRSLPQVVSEERQTRRLRALGQHSTQAELAFKHTDRGFHAAAKPLQLSKPLRSLMRFFPAAQATHLWDADSLNTGLAKFHRVIGTAVASIGSKFFRLYAESGFCLVQGPKAVRSCRSDYPCESHSER
jgi:hypothetical protein